MKYTQVIDNGLFYVWKTLVLVFPLAFLGYIFTNITKMFIVKDRYASFEDSIDFKIFIFDSFFVLGLMLCSSVLLFYLFSSRTKTLRTAKEFLFIVIGYLFFRSIVYPVLTCSESGMKYVGIDFKVMFMGALPQMLFFGFWLMYICKSRKVRTTYTKNVILEKEDELKG